MPPDKNYREQLDDSNASMKIIEARRQEIKDQSDLLKGDGERYQNLHEKTSEKMKKRKPK